VAAIPPRFATVAKLADIPPGGAKAVQVGSIHVALFNLDGTVYAVENVCPHAGGPLALGPRRGNRGELVECPWHGWRFDVRTGESPDLPGERVCGFPVRLRNGCVQVAVLSVT
jgi:nitrite reductase (NADH) small subunit/3-phenylpropionate/trans-cinnamate dioxygenase ferredoxin subunit